MTANSKKFQFAYDSTKGKYGYTIDGTFYPFSGGAIYLGQYSANTTIDVSGLGATSASQFLAVCDTDGTATGSNRIVNAKNTTLAAGGYFYAPTLALAGNTLSVAVGRCKCYAEGRANVAYGVDTYSNVPTKVYFVGNIGTR